MPKIEHVTVRTVDAEIQFDVKSNITVGDLMKQVSKSLGIVEDWFFGLKQKKDGKFKWLKSNKKVSRLKQKDGIHVMYGIKLYFGDVCQVINESTQFYFYRDLALKLRSGELQCDAEILAKLALNQVIIENGPYYPGIEESELVSVGHCIPQRIIDQYDLTIEDWKAKILALYKISTIPKEDAVLEFLKECQDLPTFGLEFFDIINTKDTHLVLGVGITGLNIYSTSNRVTPSINFPWNEIKSIKRADPKLILVPREQANLKTPDLVFICPSKPDCRGLMHIVQKYYEMYSGFNCEESIEVQRMRREAEARAKARHIERKRFLEECEKRQLLERRVAETAREFAEQEAAFLKSRGTLEQLQRQLKEMQIQLMNEQKCRQELKVMNEQLEDFSVRLQQVNAESVEERERLTAERDKVLLDIEEQRALLAKQELEKKEIEEKVAQLKANQESSMKEELNGNAINLKPMKPPCDNEQVANVTLDENLVKQLDMLSVEFQKARQHEKMEQIDHDYQAFKDSKMDKYKTLKNIRTGFTKQRIEQFESM